MAPFLATFVESGNYSADDIAALKRIVQESESNPPAAS
jgi:predicted transcriptional regulator